MGKSSWFFVLISLCLLSMADHSETEKAFAMAPEAEYDMGQAMIDMLEFER